MGTQASSDSSSAARQRSARAACTGSIVLSGSCLLLRPAVIGSFSASCTRCSEETARHSFLFFWYDPLSYSLVCGAQPFESLIARDLRLSDLRPCQLFFCSRGMEDRLWTFGTQ